MPLSDSQRLIARARLFRRTGKTYDEIRAALGVPVSDDQMKAWLRGIPRPPETRRSRALVELRRECRRLRAQGMTYNEIIEATGASVGSLSLWLRGQPGPDGRPYNQREHLRRIQPLGAQARRAQAAERRDIARRRGADRVKNLTAAELFVIGVALYWAEGTKDKPWRRTSRVTLINADADVIRIFLAWLDLLGIPQADRQYRLNIHESAEVSSHEAWWAAKLEIPLASFSRATIKRHRPITARLNVGDDYHGCVTVSVRRSRRLYDEIEGAWRAIVKTAVEAL
jgi:transcriptional regulator with XRE-family HTH domain